MTTNLTTLSKRILNNFTDRRGAVTGKITPPLDVGKEVAALQKLNSGEIWITPSGVRAFDFFYDGSYCVAMTFELVDEEKVELKIASADTVKPVDVVGSVYLYLADVLKLKPTLYDPLSVEQFISGPAESTLGVDLEVLKDHLEVLTIFSVNDNSIFDKKTSNKYVGNYLSTFDADFKLKNSLSKQAVKKIRELFHTQKKYLPESNFFEAMSTPLLKHAFLEIYRSFEFVFVLPRALALQTKLNTLGSNVNMNVLDFARECYKELGWKRVERDSIIRIFKSYADFDYNNFVVLASNSSPFKKIKKVTASDDEEDKTAFVLKISERFYELRNQIAHQFWDDDVVKCSDNDFQALIEFTLGCIDYIYKKHLSN